VGRGSGAAALTLVTDGKESREVSGGGAGSGVEAGSGCANDSLERGASANAFAETSEGTRGVSTIPLMTGSDA
jgi:hypothetical protein